ncbi:MAG: hypothetical protein AAF125_13185, partial [Chloroflexota bacterium]
MTPLTYHQRTFDLLGITPRLSEQAAFWLDRIEVERGIQLHTSLRELLAIDRVDLHINLWSRFNGGLQPLSKLF